MVWRGASRSGYVQMGLDVCRCLESVRMCRTKEGSDGKGRERLGWLREWWGYLGISAQQWGVPHTTPHEHYRNRPWFGIQVLWAHGLHQGLYHKYAWVFYMLIPVTAANCKLQWSIQLSAYPGSKGIGILSILKMHWQNRKYAEQWDIVWSCECTFILIKCSIRWLSIVHGQLQ